MTPTSHSLRLGVLERDDIGHEIVPASVEIAKAAASKFGVSIEWHDLPIGRRALDTHGSTLPRETLEALPTLDGWILGPIGHRAYPKVPEAINPHRATEFPRRWRLEATLLDGTPAVDATVARHGGKWWMFVALGHDSHNEALHLYWSERLRGPWRPHAANPVKIDATSARPAGALFRRQDRLIRPAQDCSRTYGGAITLNEMTALTPERFEERAIGQLRPDWLPGNRGLHTLSHGERLEMIDGRMRARAGVRFPPGATSRNPFPRPWVAAAAPLPRSRAAR